MSPRASSRRSRASTPLVLLALAVLLFSTSSGAASHWTLYRSGSDDSAGVTHEPDGAVFNAAENTLDGRTDRVTLGGGLPGDGGLFLDARTATRAGVIDIYAGELAAAFNVPAGLLLPPQLSTSAWYGWWSDLDTDGLITDRHDEGTRCNALASRECGPDEFLWRGLASGDILSIVAFINPVSDVAGLGTTAQGNRSSNRAVELADETALSRDEQVWAADSLVNLDGGLLTTLQILVAADAPASGGSEDLDLDAPGVLIDVDRHVGVNPDVEMLWTSTLRQFPSNPLSIPGTITGPATTAVLDALSTALDAASGPIAIIGEAIAGPVGLIPFDVLDEPVADALAVASTATGFLLATSPFGLVDSLSPPTGKEPTTVEDDFEGRAIFGGVGDARGSGNSYPAYASGYHFYFDNYARSTVCAGPYARVEPIGFTFTSTLTCNYRSEDVLGAVTTGRRAGGVMLNFVGALLLWKDTNADTHIGAVCDPATPSFDAEANTCVAHPARWPHSASDAESRGVCEVSNARSGSFTVSPVGGNWPPGVILRDFRESSRVAFELHWELPLDDAPVTLRWFDACGGTSGGLSHYLESRDAIVFPGGNTVPLRIESTASIAGFKDASLGIDIASESVRDVDYFPASL